MRLFLQHDLNRVRSVAALLSNENRLRMLLVLKQNGDQTLAEMHDALKMKYQDTVYRLAESLCEARIVSKAYDPKEKVLKYSLADQEICILV
jgi:DNA-binding transcriptional ArsR family regulator